MTENAKLTYEFDSFRLIPAERQLLRDGKTVPLPPKAFDTLVILIQNSGHALKKDDLIKRVWPDSFVEESNLNHYISVLRKALTDTQNGDGYVETVRGYGFRFKANVRAIPNESRAVLVHRRTRTHVVVREQQSESLRTVSSWQTAGDRSRTARLVAIWALVVLVGGIVGWYFGYIRPERLRRAQAASSADQQAAREAYLRGRHHWNKRSTEGLRQSIEYFKQAIEKDPNFALAYVGLGDAYLMYDQPKAEPMLRKALELDDTLGEAHASLGFNRLFWHWDWQGAEAEFARAIELNPNYATAHQWYGIYLAAMGRLDEAKKEMQRALAVDPLSPNMSADLCQIHYFSREYDHAIGQCRKTLQLDPQFVPAHDYLADAYLQKGMYTEAIEEHLFSVQQVAGRTLPEVASMRNAYLRSGYREFLREEFQHLREQTPASRKAWFYTRLGEKEKALAQLKRAYEDKDFFLIFIKVDPVYDDLRADLRFQDLLFRMNLN